MHQQTLVLLKPDCTRKNLIGKVIAMIESSGLRIAQAKMLTASSEILFQHYEGVGKLLTRFQSDKPADVAQSIFDSIIEFMQSDRIMALVVEGEDAVTNMRKLAGATRPREAEEGTIRASYGLKDPNGPIENVVHSSADPSEATQELQVWFPEIYA